MKAASLFRAYEDYCSKIPNVEEIFAAAGMENVYGRLDFGFFPLGSGILSAESRIEEAAIESCRILVLGNDFGTKAYLERDCPDNRERSTNATIRNLTSSKGLGLDVTTTFFTNFFMGVRREGKMTGEKTGMTRAYRDFCLGFFHIQLDILKPEIVLCLGREVTAAIGLKTAEAGAPVPGSFINDAVSFGSMRFIPIPHPSMAHFNWKHGVRERICHALETGTG